jgi:DNA-binding SARP family transcriptional activator
MEFRLLGPLEVVVDGSAVAVPVWASRQEILLGLLLLEANRVVSMDRLIDALWSGRPPRTARAQVQITVSSLRHLLGDDVITTRPPGYLIQVPAQALDLARFDSLVASGASAAAAQRFAEAADCLRAALALWRGTALEGVESELVRTATVRLNERRIAAWQDCVDLELRLGRHADLIGELAKLAAEHPLNERFRAQLMLALYRSGRQADALETLRTGRQLLRSELGLDPGEELSRLERSILTRDPQLDLPDGRQPAGPGKSEALPVPRQLPRTIADFAGREEILGDMAAVLSGGDVPGAPDVPVVVLTGRGGTGKTALAVRAAHLLRPAFPDGQLFLQLRTDMRLGASGLLERLLRSLGIHPDSVPGDLEGRAALYRSWLAQRRVLIVIDGAVSASQLRHFLPGSQGCAVIITSVQRLASLEGARQIDVGPLDDQAAYDLLVTLLGARRVAAEEQAVRELIRLCEGLPLGLRIVAGKLAARPHWRISQMVRQLLNEERRLDELDLDGVSVRATLALAYESLEPDARRLFRRLSLLGADDFASWVGAPLLDQDVDTADELLHELIRSHLVETIFGTDDSIRFHLHDLVRIYAVERLVSEEPAADRVAAVHRLLGGWLSIAAMAHRRIYGGDFGILHGTAEHWPLPPDMVESLLETPADWFRNERTALVAAIYRAGQLNLDELCWDLAVTSASLFESGYYGDDWRESHASALSVVRNAQNRRGEAALLCSLGNLDLGADMTTARHHYERSVEIFEELGDHQGSALALSGLASVDRLSGEYDIALSYYHQAAAGFQVAGDLIGEAHTLRTMAQIHADWLDFDVAEELLRRSLAITGQLGTKRLTAQAQYELAELQLRRGRLPAAAALFGEVLDNTRAANDVVGQVYALAGLGNARRRLGDLDGAEDTLGAALDLTQAGDDRLIRGRVLLAMAELDFTRNRFNLALARIDEAIRVLEELGSARVWHARALELLGRLHERAGRASIAGHTWETATELVGQADPALADQLARELARLRDAR